MEIGVLKDWGAFTSEGAGYCIVEGTNVEVMKMTEQYVPYVQYEIKPVLSAEEVNELIAHLSGLLKSEWIILKQAGSEMPLFAALSSSCRMTIL